MENSSRVLRIGTVLAASMFLCEPPAHGLQDESIDYRAKNVGAVMQVPADWHTLDAELVRKLTKDHVADGVTYDVAFVRDSSEILLYPYILVSSLPGEPIDLVVAKMELEKTDINDALEESTGVENALLGRQRVDVQPSKQRLLWRFNSTDKNGDEASAEAGIYTGKKGGFAVYCYKLNSDTSTGEVFRRILDSVRLEQAPSAPPPVDFARTPRPRDRSSSTGAWRMVESGVAGVLVTLMAAALVWVAGRAFARKPARGSSAGTSHNVPHVEPAATQETIGTTCDHRDSIVKAYPHGIVKRYSLMILLIIGGVALTTVARGVLGLSNPVSNSPFFNMICLIPALAYWDWLRRSVFWKCRACKQNVPWAG